jgi:hypothetical protein
MIMQIKTLITIFLLKNSSLFPKGVRSGIFPKQYAFVGFRWAWISYHLKSN